MSVCLLFYFDLFDLIFCLWSAEADDWGEVYPNISGRGCLGMIIKGAADISLAAMYAW